MLMEIQILNKIQGIKNKNMKKIFSITAIAVTILISFTGCIKNAPVLVEGKQVEFDATSWNTNAAGLTYPIIPRIPGYGRVASTADSTLRRYPQIVRVRINLIGAQLTSPETVGYEVTTTSPITSIAMPSTITGQTPAAAAATLVVSNAIAGTHYTALSGILTFPVNSSFVFLDIPILSPAATAGEARYIGLKLNNNGFLKPALNYSELGLVVDQR
jgi:hypothetical protein